MELSDIDPDCMVAEDIIQHVVELLRLTVSPSNLVIQEVRPSYNLQMLGGYDELLRKLAMRVLSPLSEALLSMPAQERMDILEELSRRHD